MVKKVSEKTKAFRSTVKKTISSALVGAFGLVTGLAWKEVVDVYLALIVSPEQSKLISALVITVISVICIVIITKILADDQAEQK